MLACAYSAAFNVWFLFLPSYVTATGGSSLVGCVDLRIGRPAGHRGHRTALRPAVGPGRAGDRCCWAQPASLAVVAVPVYLWMLAGSTLALLLGSVVMGVIIGAFVIPAFFAEQFPARVRATGLGLAYGVGSAVVGGTAPRAGDGAVPTGAARSWCPDTWCCGRFSR